MSFNFKEPTRIKPQSGFTIIEIIIATAVFSVVLLLLIEAIIIFYRGYYKSLISSSTQNAVQNISDIMAQNIRLSSAATPPIQVAPVNPGTPGYMCIGNTEFVYDFDKTPRETDIPQFALYELPEPPGCPQNPWVVNIPFWKKGNSLLADNFRLLKLAVTHIGLTNLWHVDVEVAYTSGLGGSDPATIPATPIPAGDVDLCEPSVSSPNPGNCNVNVPPSQYVSYFGPQPPSLNIVCRAGAGSQFCYVADLQTNVETRF